MKIKNKFIDAKIEKLWTEMRADMKKPMQFQSAIPSQACVWMLVQRNTNKNGFQSHGFKIATLTRTVKNANGVFHFSRNPSRIHTHTSHFRLCFWHKIVRSIVISNRFVDSLFSCFSLFVLWFHCCGAAFFPLPHCYRRWAHFSMYILVLCVSKLALHHF